MKDSLKNRFALLLIVSLLCMVGLVTSQLYYEQTITRLNQQRFLLASLPENLLRLRIEQKHFTNQSSVGSVDRINNLVSELSAQLMSLYRLIDDYKLPTTQTKIIKNSLASYQLALNQTIELRLQIGVDEENGARGEFRQATHRLETQLQRQDSETLQIKLLQMRRNEKDLIERKSPEYVAEQAQWKQHIELAIQQDDTIKNSDLLPLLEEYQRGFDQLVQLYDELGLSTANGALQQFQSYSDVINDKILTVSTQLEAIVKKISK